jgi:hypothetical protein
MTTNNRTNPRIAYCAAGDHDTEDLVATTFEADDHVRIECSEHGVEVSWVSNPSYRAAIAVVEPESATVDASLARRTSEALRYELASYVLGPRAVVSVRPWPAMRSAAA